MNDEEEKKAVAFAVQFLENFDVTKDIRDNTWPAYSPRRKFQRQRRTQA